MSEMTSFLDAPRIVAEQRGPFSLRSKKIRNASVLLVSTADQLGGAERVAANLFNGLRQHGHDAWLGVGRKRGQDPNVFAIDHSGATTGWQKFWWTLHERLQPYYGSGKGAKALCRLTHRLAAPRGWWDERWGVEDFNYPGVRRLLELAPSPPDILHCHNLHGKYFDLRELPTLSGRVTTVLTLHDAWLLAGHCAHSFDCERWQTGCGQCPDLSIYPAVRRDSTALNWQTKRDIFAQCRLHVATPSAWLMDKVRRSMLASAIASARVIPNGVDLGVFKPAPRDVAREKLALPQDAYILLFSGYAAASNPWKDFATMRDAVMRLARTHRERALLFIVLGENGATQRFDSAELRFIPHQSALDDVARYYQAADIYVHASRADTFPNSILEALACGIPVVATAVGGIPEQIRSLRDSTRTDPTGILVPAADSEAMACELDCLLGDKGLRLRLGAAAAKDAAERFGLDQQVETYRNWYSELLTTRDH